MHAHTDDAVLSKLSIFWYMRPIQCKERMQLQWLTSDYKGEVSGNVNFLKHLALIGATIDSIGGLI